MFGKQTEQHIDCFHIVLFTLPVTVVSTWRPFSTFKLIKYKTNSTDQTRRIELPILPIEKQQPKWTIKSYHSVNAKARKIFYLDNNSIQGLLRKKKYVHISEKVFPQPSLVFSMSCRFSCVLPKIYKYPWFDNHINSATINMT